MSGLPPRVGTGLVGRVVAPIRGVPGRVARGGIAVGSGTATTLAVGVTVGVAAGRLGASLVAPTLARPQRAGAAAVAGGRVVWDAQLSVELRSLLDVRRARHHRRVVARDDRVHLEARGLTGAAGSQLAAVLQDRLAGADGVLWWQVNAVTGRVMAGLDPERRSVADVLAIVCRAEQDVGTSRLPWDRHLDLPGDREPLLAAALALAADLAGVVVVASTRAVPTMPGAKVFTATLALVDAQPRLRGTVERYLGPARSDLLITVGNAAALAINRGAATLLVDAGQRVCAVLELWEARRSWQKWEMLLHGPAGVSVSEPLLVEGRPVALPRGPIERLADQAASGSLLAAAASLIGRQGVGTAADALLVGVPKAARTSRESFASVLSAALSRQGVLTLDPRVWRRLDRVSAIVVDGAALRGGHALVLDAECLDDGWTREHVWSTGQRLLWQGGRTPEQGGPAELPIPPPRGREGRRLRLGPAIATSGGHDRSGPGWRDVLEDGQVVGRVLIGSEPHARADSLLAAARRSGLRVLLSGEGPGSELRSRADEVIGSDASLTQTVRRLQEAGHLVAVVSSRAHRALAAADVGIGVAGPQRAGQRHVPWTADVVCKDLAAVEQIVAATYSARAVSERGRTLALSGSALGGLMLIAGARRGAWHRAVSPVAGAALMGLLFGSRTAWLASRPPSTPEVPLLPWHCLEADEVLLRLAAAPEDPAEDNRADRVVRGPWARLPGVENAARLRAPAVAAVSLVGYLRQELADPLTPVLTVGAAASAILGAPTDAALVGSVMGVNALVSALQRQRADRALHDLRLNERVLARRLAGPAARDLGAVLGDWREALQPVERLRPGDVIRVGPGDVVPADGRLLAVDGLEVDESGLTGESVTVDKQLVSTPGAALAERACMVFEGSVVVAGSGRAVVVAVGPATHAGRAIAAVPLTAGSGGVQAQLRALTDKALPLTLSGGVLVSGLGVLRGQPLRAAVSDGVAMAVAAVPEGLPLVATVSQLSGARRLSRRGVLVRASRTVEALGRVDTMCFDKTGTLTHGVLQLVELADLNSTWTMRAAEGSPNARRLLRAAARACPDPQDGPVLHATDRAVLEAADLHLGRQAVHVWDLLDGVPFESNRGFAAALGQGRRAMRLIVKGAPEVLLPRCTHALRLTDTEQGREMIPLGSADREAALGTVNSMAVKGLRVLLVARRELPDAPADLEAAVEKLTLMGFIGLADTARTSTLPVITQLAANGITVRMITGDHPVTAQAIAEQLGIGHRHVVTGAELDGLDETARTRVINRATVFARVTPEHKVRIVEALQRTGKVVAMTGDGSNDAAAIRLADVGIGLAATGSGAARNAADLVLTKPDLTLLLDALVEGRVMWQRVRDAVAILVGGNAGEVAFTVLGTALSGRAPVGTRQFLLVNLLTDMFPAMAVALARPRPLLFAPREPDGASPEERRAAQVGAELATLTTPELGQALMRSVAIRGTATAAGAGAAWLIGRGTGPARRASTMGLVALVGTQLGQTLLLGGRSPMVWVTAGVSGAVLVAVVQIPGVSGFFGCTPLDPAAWVIVAGSATAATLGSVLVPRALPHARRPLEALVDRLSPLLEGPVRLLRVPPREPATPADVSVP